MAKAKTQIIRDRSGAVLWSGPGRTLKEFVEWLVQEKQSLAGADLTGLDLSGLNLDGAVLDGAQLDDADLRGASLRHASINHASLKGVQAQGLNAEHSLFHGVDLRPSEKLSSRFDGARLAYSELCGALIDHASFENAGLSRTSFAHAKGRKTSFVNASLHDADFSYSVLIGCSFKKAQITASTRMSAAHLPDRTRGMTCVNNAFSQAVMDVTTPAFQSDHRWSRALKYLAWGVATAPIAFTSHMLPIHHVQGPSGYGVVSDVLQSTATVVVVTGLAIAMKEFVVEHIRDWVEEKFEDLHVGMRRAYDEAWKLGANLKEMVAASIFGPGLRAVRAGLKATRARYKHEGGYAGVTEVEGSRGKMIFCDRRHLALALESISAGRSRHRLEGDLVVVRRGSSRIDAPAIVRYRADGGTSMAWVEGTAVAKTVEFDIEGAMIAFTGDVSMKSELSTVLDQFEAAMLDDHAVNLSYPRRTHELRAGRDGSVLVFRSADGRPDNPQGPALLTIDGTSRNFRNGGEAIDTPDVDIDADDITASAPRM